MTPRLVPDDLIHLVWNVLHPQECGLTSEQLNQQLLLFCIHCPDPAAAMDIVVETLGPVTATQLVDRALACPPRDVASLPESELPLSHPLRTMKVD